MSEEFVKFRGARPLSLSWEGFHRVYTYDDRDRLSTIVEGGTVNMSFDYCPSGQLMKQVTSGVEERHLYLGSEIYAKYDASGNLTARYIHGPGLDRKVGVVPYSGGTPGNTRYFFPTPNGSVHQVAEWDPTLFGGLGGSTLLDTRLQSAFGEPILAGISGAATNAATEFGYTGRRRLGNSGLYDYRNRIYDPALGRFLTPDPLGTEPGMNLYGYVDGDPVNQVDPWGLDPQDPLQAFNRGVREGFYNRLAGEVEFLKHLASRNFALEPPKSPMEAAGWILGIAKKYFPPAAAGDAVARGLELSWYQTSKSMHLGKVDHYDLGIDAGTMVADMALRYIPLPKQLREKRRKRRASSTTRRKKQGRGAKQDERKPLSGLRRYGRATRGTVPRSTLRNFTVRAFVYRKNRRILKPKGMKANIAVMKVEYAQEGGLRGIEYFAVENVGDGDKHSEVILQELVGSLKSKHSSLKVLGVFTERSPCKHCRKVLAGPDFKGVPVYYKVKYSAQSASELATGYGLKK